MFVTFRKSFFLSRIQVVVLALVFVFAFTPFHLNGSGSSNVLADSVVVGSSAIDYPRVIRLAHSGNANGAIITISDSFIPYQSTDNGLTWSPLTALPSATGICCPALFELPQAMGDLPAGALLVARTEGAGARIEVYSSIDQGKTWIDRSTIASGGQGGGYGLWEPELTVDRAGDLVVFYSDERHQGDGYSQLLGHEVSTDGGLTWSSEMYDVAVNDTSTRPGMARVVQLPSGTYVMAYEVCGNPGCSVHIRTSTDGDNWGSVTNLGTQVSADDGSYFVSSPGLVWSPAGGGNGELILLGKYLENASGGHQSGNTIFVTTDLTGQSGWSAQAAPLNVTVPAGGDHCANYSSSLLPSADGTSLLEVAGAYESNGQCQTLVASSSTTSFTGPISAPGGKCVDVSNSNSADGTPVQIYDCNNTNAQVWTLTPNHTLQALGKCLDIIGNGTAAGTKVELWDCNGVGGQQWVPQANGSLSNPQSGRCLDDPAGNTANGTQLQIWDCNNLWPQVFRLPG